MTVIGTGANCISEAGKVAQHVGNWLVDGPKNVFSNIDPLSDLLKLIQRINDIFKYVGEIYPLKQIAGAVSHITDFINARSFIGKISDIVSGKAAWDKPFGDNFPDLLKVASKCAYLIGDFASTAKWLSMINVLGSWVKDSTAQIVTWGKEFNILKGIGDVSCITGALLNMADTVRQIVEAAIRGKYFEQNKLQLSLLVDHVLDVAQDTAKIAGAILSNIPGVHILFTFVSLAIGSTLSLTKFFKKTYWVEEPVKPLIADGSSVGSSSSSPSSSRSSTPGLEDLGDPEYGYGVDEDALAAAVSAQFFEEQHQQGLLLPTLTESAHPQPAVEDSTREAAAASATASVAESGVSKETSDQPALVKSLQEVPKAAAPIAEDTKVAQTTPAEQSAVETKAPAQQATAVGESAPEVTKAAAPIAEDAIVAKTTPAVGTEAPALPVVEAATQPSKTATPVLEPEGSPKGAN